MQKLCLVILILSHLLSNANYSKTDSLYLALEQSNGKEKVYIHQELSYYIRSINIDTSFYHAKQGVKLGKTLQDTLGVMLSLNELGACYMQVEQYDLAIRSFVESMAWNSNYSRTYGELSLAFEKIGAFKQAVKAEVKRASFFENTAWDKFFINGNIGRMYMALNQLDSTLQYFKKGEAIANFHNDPFLKTHAYNNLALLYIKKADYKKALSTFDSSLEEWSKNQHHTLSDSILWGVINGNIGSVYYHLDQYKTAVPFYLKDIQMAKHFKQLELEIRASLRLSETYIQLGKLDEAEQILINIKALISLSQKTIHLEEYLKLYKTLSLKQNKLKEAFAFQSQSIQLKDSLFSNEHIQTQADAQALYLVNTIKSKLNIERLEKLQKEKLLKIKSYQLWLVVILGFVLISFLIVLVRNKKLQIKKAHQKISFHTKELKNLMQIIAGKNALIHKIEAEIPEKEISTDILNSLKSQKIQTEEDWSYFKTHIDIIYPAIIEKLKDQYLGITKGELRLFVVIKIGLRTSEIANTLGISTEGVKKSRQRLRKKLALDSNVILEEFVATFS